MQVFSANFLYDLQPWQANVSMKEVVKIKYYLKIKRLVCLW
ncbi:hypothetical protein PPRY_a3443 [Pseudoalteromonas prydzensis ACAM 620]|nr:hypothetical protein [Pseudoalteromonas prydzensis ACAM 620]